MQILVKCEQMEDKRKNFYENLQLVHLVGIKRPGNRWELACLMTNGKVLYLLYFNCILHFFELTEFVCSVD